MPVRLVDMVGQAGCASNLLPKNHHSCFLCCAAKHGKPVPANLGSRPPRASKTDSREPAHVDELVDISERTVHGEPAQACPWKAAREAVSGADVFVGDYNHLFDDGVEESASKRWTCRLRTSVSSSTKPTICPTAFE